MIRAILHLGTIQPIDALPADWPEGQELAVEPVGTAQSAEDLEAWSAELEAATAGITDEMHVQLMNALHEIEVESKELGRREMERSP